jgi:hypothetical protein
MERQSGMLADILAAQYAGLRVGFELFINGTLPAAG